MVPSRSSSSTRAAFAPPASGAARFPASSLIFGPPTPSPPLAFCSGHPLLSAYLPTFAAGEMRVSQVPGSSLRSCRGHVPRRVHRPLALRGDDAAAYGVRELLGTRNAALSWLDRRGPFARRLRIAGVVTSTVARLATGLWGSTLAGRASHPPDDIPEFRSTIACLTPFETSLAWSQPPRTPHGSQVDAGAAEPHLPAINPLAALALALQ
jgi:hypothetical protein